MISPDVLTPGFDAGVPPNLSGVDPMPSYMEFGPGDDVGSLVGFINGGNAPTFQQNSHLRSNGYIQRHYTVAVPGGDNADSQIMPDMLAFLSTEFDKQFGVYTMLSLGQLNCMIRESNAHYESLSDENNETGDPGFKRFKELLEKHGEKTLEELHYAKRHGIEAEMFPERDQEIQEFYRLAQEDVLRYVTKFGILNYWKFIGIVRNVSKAVTNEAFSQFDATDHILVVNVVVGQKTSVANYWGPLQNTPDGARCHLILRRKLLSNGNYGAYEFAPFASPLRDAPPEEMLLYFDASGRMCHGHSILVGTVLESNAIEPAPSRVAMALGQLGDFKEVYNNHAGLPVISINVIM